LDKSLLAQPASAHSTSLDQQQQYKIPAVCFNYLCTISLSIYSTQKALPNASLKAFQRILYYKCPKALSRFLSTKSILIPATAFTHRSFGHFN
jgi:hypothetical protein